MCLSQITHPHIPATIPRQDTLTVRLPLTVAGTHDLERERRWLPRIAPALGVTIPIMVAMGSPAEGYPWPWAVHQWIDGETPVEGRLAQPIQLAHDLAEFVTAMRKVGSDSGPAAYRGAPLVTVDRRTRAAIGDLSHTGEPFDAAAATSAWEQALAATPWTAAPCWLHSDLMPSNLLLTAGRLTGVLDFATTGVGDLIPTWNLLPHSAREVFRNAVDVDDATVESRARLGTVHGSHTAPGLLSHQSDHRRQRPPHHRRNPRRR
ncbi:aminoglycoside phosphotransferase family protein [Nocardia sp. NPDC060249]|uniref:aminoglycoside phosphotransferase family protein n=1 Tax=Nocardia sp. NPDC060249 TaxID=3347082 RepID=UPI0036607D3E